MKGFFKNLFKKIHYAFSFEEGIDITDNISVLQRRNIVIKNIIFLSNLAYTVILFVISFITPSTTNIVITIIFFPFTFLLNKTLQKFVSDKNDLMKQQIAMYLATFYLFLSAILIYFKLKTGANEISEAGYILLYYALVVAALYQNKKMMTSVYLWMFVIITILHFTLTYPIYDAIYATDLNQFINTFFTTNEFKDIALRTMILLVFMVIIYSQVEIGQFLFEERQKEASKRASVESNFGVVVSNLFKTILDMRYSSDDEMRHAEIVGEIAKRLAMLMNNDHYESIYKYAIIHVKEKEMITKRLLDEDYMVVKKQAEIGSLIVKRLQLAQKCDDIIRYHLEGWANKEFSKRMNSIQMEYDSQFVLLADLYVTLRNARAYKRPYTQRQTMDIFDKELHQYVEESLYDKFLKYINEFEAIYNR